MRHQADRTEAVEGKGIGSPGDIVVSVCKRPGTVAVTAPDRYTFIFGDLVGDAGASAIASFVASFAKANLGPVPWRERPQIIRRGLLARIPPAIWSPADGKPPT